MGDSFDNKKKRNRLRRKRPDHHTISRHPPNPNPSESLVWKRRVPCPDNVDPSATLLRNETMYSEATVLSLGPTFMSIYIPSLAIERRIHYGEVEDLTAEWLDATSTLLLGRSVQERPPNRQTRQGRFRPLEDIAELVSPVVTNDSKIVTYSSDDHDDGGGGGAGKSYGLCGADLEPSFFPLTLHLKSTVPVALHPVGGGDGPRDIVARLYVTSYFQ